MVQLPLLSPKLTLSSHLLLLPTLQPMMTTDVIQAFLQSLSPITTPPQPWNHFLTFHNPKVTLPTNRQPFQNKPEPQQPNTPQVPKPSGNLIDMYVIANLMGLFCPYTRSMTATQGLGLLCCSTFHIFTKKNSTEIEGSGNSFCLKIKKQDRFLRVWECLICCLSLCNLLQFLERQFGNNYQYTYCKTHNSTLQ